MNTEYSFRYWHLVPVLLLLLGAGIAVLNHQVLDSEVRAFPANASVETVNTSSVGVVTGSNLNFGKVPEGSQVRKNLELQSDSLVLVRFRSTGNISGMLDFKRSIELVNQTEVEVSFNATDSGYYSGSLVTEILKPRGTLGERWLKLRSETGI